MDITKYMKRHEAYVKEQLLAEGDRRQWSRLMETHERITSAMQHERLIHLLVTLAFGVFFLLSMAMAFIEPSWQVLILMGLFFVLVVPYIAHYFFLENTVQRWYTYTDEIEKRLRSLDDD
jgi:hypothetical protein